MVRVVKGETEREGSRKNFIGVYIKEKSAEDNRGGHDVEQNSTTKKRRQNSDEGTSVVMECGGENCIHQVHERHVESLWKRRRENILRDDLWTNTPDIRMENYPNCRQGKQRGGTSPETDTNNELVTDAFHGSLRSLPAARYNLLNT
ncbi:hypothetical protein RUM43_009352 [Polyplax serrata]|uniref:Uncharacterized protein n=1 Tax=Polyplax serrata TaxID=468196 RepID=A0AAN8NPE9_POLSC